MEIEILEDKKKRLVFELRGVDHTLCNIVREELWNDKSITVSAYNIQHPLISVPKFIIETDGKDPKKALNDAIKRIKDKNKKLLTQVKKI